MTDIPIGWKKGEEGLSREFTFADFKEAFSFMTHVALIAEKMDHHPNWSNSYKTVTIDLNTHSAAGKVTEKDIALAKAINGIK